MSHVTTCDIPRASWVVTVEMHLETGLHFGPSWIRRIWRSFLVRWISNFGTVNFGTPQHSRNHSNHSFNRLTIVSKVVITLESRKITSRLLELSKANRFYISEQGLLWKVLSYFSRKLKMASGADVGGQGHRKFGQRRLVQGRSYRIQATARIGTGRIWTDRHRTENWDKNRTAASAEQTDARKNFPENPGNETKTEHQRCCPRTKNKYARLVRSVNQLFGPWIPGWDSYWERFVMDRHWWYRF